MVYSPGVNERVQSVEKCYARSLLACSVPRSELNVMQGARSFTACLRRALFKGVTWLRLLYLVYQPRWMCTVGTVPLESAVRCTRMHRGEDLHLLLVLQELPSHQTTNESTSRYLLSISYSRGATIIYLEIEEGTGLASGFPLCTNTEDSCITVFS